MIYDKQKGRSPLIGSHITEAYGYCKDLTLSLAIPRGMSYWGDIHDNTQGTTIFREKWGLHWKLYLVACLSRLIPTTREPFSLLSQFLLPKPFLPER